MSVSPGSQRVGFVEVGPRDGFQNWPDPVPTPVKLALIDGALAAGVPRVEVTSLVSPKWVPQLADAETVLSQLSARGRDTMARVRVLVPNLKGLERALAFVEAGLGNVLVNVGVTDGFNQHNLNRSVAETLAEIKAVVDTAAPAGVRVDASISVAWGCPYDGPVAPQQTIEVAARVADLGVSELSFGDTIGVAAPAGVKALSELALERLRPTRPGMCAPRTCSRWSRTWAFAPTSMSASWLRPPSISRPPWARSCRASSIEPVRRPGWPRRPPPGRLRDE